MIASAEPQLICPITGTPCRGWDNSKPAPKPKRKKTNGRIPAWALPIEVLSARNIPAWERQVPKRQKTLKMGEVATWIREHPEWVAGRLVSDHPGGVRVVYYSEPGDGGKTCFQWAFESQQRHLAVRAGFKEYASFAEWEKAKRT